jgi:hypothetical protein
MQACAEGCKKSEQAGFYLGSTDSGLVSLVSSALPARNSLMLLPRAQPISGSLQAPKMISIAMRIRPTKIEWHLHASCLLSNIQKYNNRQGLAQDIEQY